MITQEKNARSVANVLNGECVSYVANQNGCAQAGVRDDYIGNNARSIANGLNGQCVTLCSRRTVRAGRRVTLSHRGKGARSVANGRNGSTALRNGNGQWFSARPIEIITGNLEPHESSRDTDNVTYLPMVSAHDTDGGTDHPSMHSKGSRKSKYFPPVHYCTMQKPQALIVYEYQPTTQGTRIETIILVKREILIEHSDTSKTFDQQ